MQSFEFCEHKHYEGKGRPGPNSKVKSIDWKIKVSVTINESRIEELQHKKACFILGRNASNELVSSETALENYREQNTVENGFRFLKDPLFFTSSFFLEKPERIQALLMVMTLALLVYSVAQRRLRQQLKQTGTTIPNQLNQEISTPTLRWIFQMLEGIDVVYFQQAGQSTYEILGITERKMRVLVLFPEVVTRIYGIAKP